MTHLFSAAGREALKALPLRRIVYAFDFDGTLAPIDADRQRVHIPSRIHTLVHDLSKLAPCAIVSGRSLDDLTPRVNGAAPYLIGNHGIESPFTHASVLAQAHVCCQKWVRTVGEQAQVLKQEGVEIEDKSYSLTFHYRYASDPTGIGNKLQHLFSRLDPAPRVVYGKSSVNVLPPGQWDKGAAVSSLTKFLQQDGAFYIGDEDTDEHVFELNEGLALGVHVGRPLRSSAHFYINDQGEVEDVLRFLVQHLMESTIQ